MTVDGEQRWIVGWRPRPAAAGRWPTSWSSPVRSRSTAGSSAARGEGRRRRRRPRRPRAGGRRRPPARRLGAGPGRPRGRRTSSWSTSPPAWSCTPARAPRRATLVNGLLALYPEIAGVGPGPDPPRHRPPPRQGHLGPDARGPHARRPTSALSAMLAAREVERQLPPPSWGAPCPTPTGRDRRPHRPGPASAPPAGRHRPTAAGPRTRYEVDERYTEPESASLLRVRLETGRTHQIRVHLAAIGHPVVGDAPLRRAPGAAAATARSSTAAASASTHPITRRAAALRPHPCPTTCRAVLAGLTLTLAESQASGVGPGLPRRGPWRRCRRG